MTPNNNLTNPKARGEWAEIKFMARAVEQGFQVFRPFGEAPYDVGLEHQGHFWRVQIKSSQHRRRGRSYCLHVRRTNRQPYARHEVDFLAAYLIQLDRWYIVPVARLYTPKGPISALHITPQGPRHKWQDHQEAWHLFRK